MVDSSGTANAPSSPLYVAQSEISSNASASSAANVFSIDALYYSTITIQFTAVGAGNTVTFEGSNDNASWLSVLVNRGENVTSTSNSAFVATTTMELFVPLKFRYFRARVSTYGSGTVTAFYALKSGPEAMSVSVRSGSGTYGTGYNFGAIGVTQVGGNVSRARIQSAASTNATSVKASAGQLHSLYVANNGATIAFLKLYNKASAPTVGTDVPLVTIALPISGAPVIIDLSVPDIYGTGIAYSIQGATGAADSDTSSVAANQVTGFICYG
jgi:hypothetical protein